VKRELFAGQKAGVVVVEDHDLVREGLRLWLEEIPGFHALGEARTLGEAVELIQNLRPAIVLSDLMLPDSAGPEGVERLLKEFPGLKVIVLSAFCWEDYVHRCIRAGASGYLQKDLKFEELRSALTAVAGGERYFCAAAEVHCATFIGGALGSEAPVRLTRRQSEILKLLAEGHTVKSIGHELGISSKTVDMHKNLLMRKLDLPNIQSLVRFAIQRGLVGL